MADTMTAPGHTDVGELLDRLATIAPRVRAAAAGAERDRRLAPETVEAVRGTGAYAMARPRRYDGLEMDPVSTFRVVEELSRHDSAAGWNLNLATAIKLRLQLATSHATTCAARAVDLVHAAAGTAAILETYRFPRHLRDVHTVTQHAFASAQRYESVGAPLLGAESDWGFFAF